MGFFQRLTMSIRVCFLPQLMLYWIGGGIILMAVRGSLIASLIAIFCLMSKSIETGIHIVERRPTKISYAPGSGESWVVLGKYMLANLLIFLVPTVIMLMSMNTQADGRPLLFYIAMGVMIFISIFQFAMQMVALSGRTFGEMISPRFWLEAVSGIGWMQYFLMIVGLTLVNICVYSLFVFIGSTGMVDIFGLYAVLRGFNSIFLFIWVASFLVPPSDKFEKISVEDDEGWS